MAIGGSGLNQSVQDQRGMTRSAAGYLYPQGQGLLVIDLGTINHDDDNVTDGGGASATITYTAKIPAGWVMLGGDVNVLETFQDDGSCTLTIGDGADQDRFNANANPDVYTATGNIAWWINDVGGAGDGEQYCATATDLVLTLTGNADWGNVTQGQMKVRLFGYQLHNIE